MKILQNIDLNMWGFKEQEKENPPALVEENPT